MMVDVALPRQCFLERGFGATLNLHVDNWECRAQNCQHGAKKFIRAMPILRV